jgi:putative colanic acid biosynthesis acetyltransferase WcaF
MPQELDIGRNRAERKYTARELALRAAWAVGRVVFALTPGPLYGARAILLRLFGAKVARHVRVARTARIRFPWNLDVGEWSSIGDGARVYNLGPVTIGRKATISQGAHLCAGAHDAADPAMRLLKPPIRIGDQAWVCADAFVGPGVTIGEGAVLGARAVAVRDIPPWTIAAGNPARVVKERRLETDGKGP